jgi:hypothetical protein
MTTRADHPRAQAGCAASGLMIPALANVAWLWGRQEAEELDRLLGDGPPADHETGDRWRPCPTASAASSGVTKQP